MAHGIAHRSGRPRVLLAWELGDGLGHVGRLLPLAARLLEEGFEPVFALRDPLLAGRRAAMLGHAVLQAPVMTPRRMSKGFFARSFADILSLVGFEDEARLAAMLHAWRSLVDLVAPTLVIGDFCPALALAMQGARAPLLLVGSGFALPPGQLAHFPVINKAGVAMADPERLARTVAAVLPPASRVRADALPRLLAGDWQAACTWPLLDPYRATRAPAALGPMGRTPPMREVGARAGWFAYLAADAPRARPIIEALLASPHPGSAFVRGADAALRARFAATRHVLNVEPPPLGDALARVGLVIHHGGINTTETALAMGVPQLVLSRHLEQHLTASAIQAAGAGRWLRGVFTAADATQAIDTMLATDGFEQAARRIAAGVADRGGAVDRVAAAALSLMPRSIAGAA